MPRKPIVCDLEALAAQLSQPTVAIPSVDKGKGKEVVTEAPVAIPKPGGIRIGSPRPSETPPMSKKRFATESEGGAPKKVRSTVVVAPKLKEAAKPSDRAPGGTPSAKAQSPQLQLTRPLSRDATVRDARVAANCSQVFYLPGDLEAIRRKSSPSIGENLLSHLGQSIQHAKVLWELLDERTQESRASRAQVEQALSRVGELKAEINSLKSGGETLKKEKESLASERDSLVSDLKKRTAELQSSINAQAQEAERVKAERKYREELEEKVKGLEEKVKGQEEKVKELEVEKEKEYDAGVYDAQVLLASQLSSIKDKARSEGWFLAIKAAGLSADKIGLERGPKAYKDPDADGAEE